MYSPSFFFHFSSHCFFVRRHHLGLRKACQSLTFMKLMGPRLQRVYTAEETRQAERVSA